MTEQIDYLTGDREEGFLPSRRPTLRLTKRAVSDGEGYLPEQG